jgi:DNA-binding transcriptional LysR family regulator
LTPKDLSKKHRDGTIVVRGPSHGGIDLRERSTKAMSDSLEFRLLKYIVAVAETSNFTRAAERLFLAQPSLSKQIRDLEEEIKFPLFDRSRDGVKITAAGEMVLAYARETLRAREELVTMARAVHLGEVPPLRLGFSSFVSPSLLQSFRERYQSMFPGCEIQLAGGDLNNLLQRMKQRSLDCTILPMPIESDIYHVQQISQSPLVVCLRSDDPLASQTQLDANEVATRIKIFRDPQLQPAAHARLIEMFHEIGMQMRVACSASTSSDIQWMVKAGYGLALIDQMAPLESGLTTRPIAEVNWTVDTAFVHHSRVDHIALPFIERSLSQYWREGTRRSHRSEGVRPEQLKLLA